MQKFGAILRVTLRHHCSENLSTTQPASKADQLRKLFVVHLVHGLLHTVLSSIEFLTQTARYIKIRQPAAAGVTVDDKEFPVLAESAAALATGVGMPSDGLRCMWDSVKPNLQAVYSDSMSPADAASESQIAAEDCLANS